MSAAKPAAGLAPRLRAWVASPAGPKTTHFWGPVANWGFVLAGLADTATKPPEAISRNMTAAMCVYSALFMRFAWMITPRNHLLLACHVCNEAVHLNQGRRLYTSRAAAAALAQPAGASSQ
jgi:hypothetical protein